MSSGPIRPKTRARSASTASSSSSMASICRPDRTAPGAMPTVEAIAATVAGSSPEMTRRSTCASTSCRSVSAASGRSSSRNARMASGRAGGGATAPGSGRSDGSASATSSTLRPDPVSRLTAGPTSASSGAARTSEAPSRSRRGRSPPSRIPDQRRSDENGISAKDGVGMPGSAAASASTVRVREVALAPTTRRIASVSAGSSPSASQESRTRRWVVRVPVLSRHSVSTRDIDSTASIRWTIAPARLIRTAASA